ncbi:MAG: peptidoglycan-binding domain-containing protein [Oscillospiraceae bacterium]
MRPPESFLNQPIRSLQTMLRVIAENNPAHERMIPDGIYGPETVTAVSTFQRLHGLPITGITDNNTWDTVVAVYEEAIIEQAEAYPLEIVLNPGQVIRKGERHPHLYLVQAILTVLSENYDSIARPEFTGILDNATSDALSTFQQITGLPMTGNLDKQTWKHLALHYPLAANLQTG